MRKPTTRLGIFQIAFVIFSFLILTVIAFWEVKLAEAYIPTVINGISTVTGIFIALASGLIVFILNQRGQYSEATETFHKHRDHAMTAIVFLAFPASTLMMAYADLIRGRLTDAVHLAMMGFYVALAIFLELAFFAGSRVLQDIDREKADQ